MWVAGSLWHTTAKDGGSAEIAGANFCPPIPGRKKGRVPEYSANYQLAGVYYLLVNSG